MFTQQLMVPFLKQINAPFIVTETCFKLHKKTIYKRVLFRQGSSVTVMHNNRSTKKQLCLAQVERAVGIWVQGLTMLPTIWKKYQLSYKNPLIWVYFKHYYVAFTIDNILISYVLIMHQINVSHVCPKWIITLY